MTNRSKKQTPSEKVEDKRDETMTNIDMIRRIVSRMEPILKEIPDDSS